LVSSIADRTSRIGVIGLGYVGLPLARTIAGDGFSVLGFDTDTDRIERLQKGKSYLMHVSPAHIRRMREQGFETTDRLARLGECDALLLCVPTSLTEHGEPDLDHLTKAVSACVRHLRRGQLVVIESTTYPGATRRVVQPLLEQSGLRVGEDFFLACSPEREDPGNGSHPMQSIPKVVGAVDPQSLQAAAALYGEIFPTIIVVSCAETAEACKLLENAYRAVNIGLVNELKVLFDRIEVDVWEVIEAAKTKPFGFHAFYPGPGLGGACIPVNPFYLSWLARQNGLATRLIDDAGVVNAAMPSHVVGRLTAALSQRGKSLRGSHVALLGVAYKKNVADCRESPALALMDLLGSRGVIVSYHDPHVPHLPVARPNLALTGESQVLTLAWLSRQDAVILVTDHSAFDLGWIVEHSALVLDTRNATAGLAEHQDRIVRA
jgi:UDP-N-acetyl-D-glucosamine dehydrogenase